MNLSDRINGINNWMEDKSNKAIKDPNMFEIMDCTVELGKLAEHGKDSEEYKKAYEQYEKMIGHRLPENVMQDQNSLVHNGSELGELFNEVSSKAKSGEYKDLKGLDGQNKKELLCRLSSVGLYIEQQKKKLENGENVKTYDNEQEFERIQLLYEDYISKDTKDIQFGDKITGMFESIQKEYELSIGKSKNFKESLKNMVVSNDKPEIEKKETQQKDDFER